MTKTETAKLFALIWAIYRQEPFDKVDKLMVDAWTAILADLPYTVAEQALYTHARTKPFCPRPFDLIDAANTMAGETDAMDDAEAVTAWGHVMKGVRNGIYHYQEEFEKLTPEEQKAVGSASQLREWAIAENPDDLSYGKAAFIRAFKAVRKIDRVAGKLPEKLVQAISEGIQKGAAALEVGA